MKRVLTKIGAVVFWLLLWQSGAMLANRNLLLPIPTPLDTVAALGRFVVQGEFWLTIGASLLRICIGFLAAVLLGTIGAILTARFAVLHTLFEPILNLIRAIPVASFTILVFLWIDRGSIPSIISFFTVLPMVWANVESGLHSTDAGLVEMARVFGMKKADVLRHISLPAIRPFFTAAVGSGLGFAWKSGVAAEVICRAQHSLGNLLWGSKASVNYDEVFAVTLVIVLLSAVLQSIARSVLKGGTQHA